MALTFKPPKVPNPVDFFLEGFRDWFHRLREKGMKVPNEIAAEMSGFGPGPTLTTYAFVIRQTTMCYLKANIVSETYRYADRSKGIPPELRDEMYDAFVLNTKKAPLKLMLEFQRRLYPEEAAAGVWPPPDKDRYFANPEFEAARLELPDAVDEEEDGAAMGDDQDDRTDDEEGPGPSVEAVHGHDPGDDDHSGGDPGGDLAGQAHDGDAMDGDAMDGEA